jgi:hypothetical protein
MKAKPCLVAMASVATAFPAGPRPAAPDRRGGGRRDEVDMVIDRAFPGGTLYEEVRACAA